uniref:AAA+ ATPase domain-containing protein n=1 Tax=Spongospora subterranea TaxID=70186 RepID=A0A0H5QXP3_9EUKA|eukprot:CRZ06511.1 hypothetical protein [Spongospora subterranea]
MEDAAIDAERIISDPACTSDDRWSMYRRLIQLFGDQEHIWCLYPGTAKFLCGLLEFPETEFWVCLQRILSRINCRDCITRWSDSVNAYLRGLHERFEIYSIDVLESHMIEADSVRLKNSVLQNALYEFLRRPQLSRHPDLNAAIVCYMTKNLHSPSLNSTVRSNEGSLLAGVYLFCVHPDPVIRSWAQSLCRGNASRIDSSDGAFISALHECRNILVKNAFAHEDCEFRGFLYNKSSFWSGICILLSIVPDSLWPNVSSLLLCGSPVFLLKLFSHSGLINVAPDGTHVPFSEDIPKDLYSAILSCFSCLCQHAGELLWVSDSIISPSVMADAFQHAIIYGSSSRTMLSMRSYISSLTIATIPKFVLSLPADEHHKFCSTAVHFLKTHSSTLLPQDPDVTYESKVCCWRAIFSIIKSLFESNLHYTAVSCCDIAADGIVSIGVSFDCSDFVNFLRGCPDFVRIPVAEEACGIILDVLNHDFEVLANFATQPEAMGFSADNRCKNLLISNAIWSEITSVPISNIPSALHSLLLDILCSATSVHPSVLYLTSHGVDQHILVYMSIRTAMQTYLQSLSTDLNATLAIFADRIDVINKLVFCLVAYPETSIHISAVIRHLVKSMHCLDDNAITISDCLSALLRLDCPAFTKMSNTCVEHCTKPAVRKSFANLLNIASNFNDNVRRLSFQYLFGMSFWLQKLLVCKHGEITVSDQLEKVPLARLWDSMVSIIASGHVFYTMQQFDRTFSAVFDLASILLGSLADPRLPFSDILKNWLSMRERIPVSTRRRWFQFVRRYLRSCPEEKSTFRDTLKNLSNDAIWLYEHGLSDTSHLNYLSQILPDILGDRLNVDDSAHIVSFTLPMVSTHIPSISAAQLNDDALADPPKKPSVMLAASQKFYPATSLKSQNPTISSSIKVVPKSSRSQIAPASKVVKLNGIVNVPSCQKPQTMQSYWLESKAVASSSDKIASYRAGLESLRDYVDVSGSQQAMIKNIVIKPLTTAKKALLRRRAAIGPHPNKDSEISAKTAQEIANLPLRGVSHFIEQVLNWSTREVVGPFLRDQISAQFSTKRYQKFPDLIAYRRYFGPLLLEEARASIHADLSQLRVSEPATISAVGRDQTATAALPGILLLFSPVEVSEQARVVENDLVALWPFQTRTTSGLVPESAKFGLVDGSSNGSRLLIRVMPPWKEDQDKPKWCYVRVCSMTTYIRNTRALETVQRLRLSSQIVMGADLYSERSTSTSTTLEHAVCLNSCQTSAIEQTLTSSCPIILLQGPPGTGKTTVIVALIKTLLAEQSRASLSRGVPGWRKARGVHILVCTPSNAAADELTSRLIDANIQSISPGIEYPLIRIGGNVTVGSRAESVALDKLAAATQLSQLRIGSQTNHGNPSTSGNQRQSSQEIRAKLVADASVLVSTLSGSGSSIVSNAPHGFHTVIIDEAAQAQEVESLIPLQYSCRKLILVGDPRQLPATVISQAAEKNGLSRSLFERLETVMKPIMLTDQYRMHPEICAFPSARFYDGKLRSASLRAPPSFYSDRLIQPYLFFDVPSEDIQVDRSKANPTEAIFVAMLFRHINDVVSQSGCKPPSVGIITPYQAQVREILRQAATLRINLPDVRTVDSFQGQERDIIIISAVRASNAHSGDRGLGFVADPRRLVVSITRAKESCLIVGCSRSLSSSKSVWADLVEDARSRRLVVNADQGHRLFDPNLTITEKKRKNESLARGPRRRQKHETM